MAAADEPIDDVDDVRLTTTGIELAGAVLRFLDGGGRVLFFDVVVVDVVVGVVADADDVDRESEGGGDVLLTPVELFALVILPLAYSLRNSSIFSSINASCPSI